MEMFNYIVISNGRSGSQLCCFLLNEYLHYRLPNVTDFFVDFQKKNTIENYKENIIYHCHNENNLLNVPDNFTVIVPHRNIFDLVISNQVASQLNCHSYSLANKNWEENPTPFEITVEDFVNDYKANLRFQIRLEKLLDKISNKIVKINYEDIRNDNNNFFKLMDLDFKLTHPLNFIKSPYDYTKLVTNYDYLKQIEIRI